MSFINNVRNKIPKYNPDMKFFSPDNRAFLMVASIAVLVFVSVVIFIFSDEDTEGKKKAVILNNIDGKAQTTSVDAEVSDLYKQSIQELNKENYDAAQKQLSGASMPVLYHDKPDTTSGSIEGCGCTFDASAREALIEELRKLGITDLNKTDGLRLGESDVYVQTDGTIIDQSGSPYLWDGEKVRSSDTGLVLHSQTGMPIETSDGQSIHLSKEGKFYNDVTAIIRLMGRMLSNDGVILLGNGFKANRPGGMTQVSDTDIYMTTDRQLATMDAKPVYNGSNPVFKDLENRLHDYYGKNIQWEDRAVFQQNDGKLTDRSGVKFSRIGILISYGGILIDNESMLTDELNNISRFADSDLYVNNQNMLVDSYGQEVTFQNYNVKVGVNNILNSEIGPVVNSSGSHVSINKQGRFVADKPVFLTGTLKDSQKVAYDRFGHRISRQGKLMQLGQSVIWHTADRYLATEDGQSLLFNKVDVFQDIRRFRKIKSLEAYGLKTSQNVIVRDLLGQEVFLNEIGQLIYENGDLVTETGILTTSEGVILTSDGTLIIGSETFIPVLNGQGEQIYYKGQKVFQGKDGRLYDEKRNLILSPSGQAMTLLDDGLVVNEDGNVIEGVFSKLSPIMANKGFQTGQGNELLDGHGNAIYFKGKKVLVGEDGHLYDENGNLLTDKNGQPLSLNKQGQIVSSNGQLADLKGFASESNLFNKVNGNKGFKVGQKNELLDDEGNQVYLNGKKVIVGQDGQLYDENGNLLSDKRGQPLSLNAQGQIITPDGKLVSTEGYAVDRLEFIPVKKNKGFKVNKNNELLDENGNQVYYNGKKVMVGEDGRLYDEYGNLITDKTGQPLSVNSKGQIVRPDGQLASIEGFETKDTKFKPVNENNGFYKGADGSLLDKDGNPLYYKGKKVFIGDDGRLYDADGVMITGEDGQTLSLNGDGQIVTPSGRVISLSDFEVEDLALISLTGNKGFKVGKNNELLDENGNQVYYNGKRVIVGDDGRLYDEDGNVLTDKNGYPLLLNSKGQIINANGELASMDGFSVKESLLKPLESNNGFKVGKNNELLDEDGKQVYYNGKKVIVGSDGRLYDENGNLLLDDNGQPLSLNNGQIITATGEVASMEGFATETEIGRELLETGSNTKLTSLGDSGIFSTKDGLLVDKKGKSIIYKGKRLRRGKNGQLFDENGKAILDKDGNPLYMNDDGKIVDVNGNPIEGVLLQNGDGQYLSGGPQGPVMRRVGNSDIYMTREGLLTDDQGKPITFKGKAVKVGEGGRIYTTDGIAVTDAEGNVVALTNDGGLKNRSGMPAKGAVLADGEGVVLDPQGLRVTNGGKLTPLGNGLYKTANGLIVDRQGRWVPIDGKQAFLDENNEIVDAHKYPLRFKGRRLNLTNTGALIDAQGNPVLEDNQAVLLTSKGFTKEDGTLIDIPDTSLPEQREANSKLKVYMKEQVKTQEKSTPVSDEKVTSSETSSDSNVDESPEIEIAKILDVSTLTDKEIAQLNKRYTQIYNSMKSKLTEYDAEMKLKPKSSTATYSIRDSVEDLQRADVSHNRESFKNNSENGDIGTRSDDLIKLQAGNVLYGANQMTVNTDLDSRVVFNLMGLPHTHPLYRGTAQGKVTLKYDHIVIAVTSLCPEKKECYPVQALAVDPTTRSASVTGEIDKHYWYRFGGLTLASLVQGAAIAVGESRDRTDTYDEAGKIVSYSGLDGKELMIRAAEPLGEALSGVFMENVNRPYTGTIAYGEEVGIFLFEDVVIRKGTGK